MSKISKISERYAIKLGVPSLTSHSCLVDAAEEGHTGGLAWAKWPCNRQPGKVIRLSSVLGNGSLIGSQCYLIK